MANNIIIPKGFDPVVLLLIGLVGITLLAAGWWTVSARGGPDDINNPTTYRIVSWHRKSWSLQHELVEPRIEPEVSGSEYRAGFHVSTIAV